MAMSGHLDADTFRPRLESYKKPYGAVTENTRVEFHVRPKRSLGVTKAALLARFEFDDNRVEQVPMACRSGAKPGQLHLHL